MSEVAEDTVQGTDRGGAVHCLVRIAERAGSGERDRPEISAGTKARDVWGDVAKAYELSDQTLSELVAEYFRLDVADFEKADPNAPLLIPETMSRKHHIFPLLEDDRHFVVATCDPTDVDAERALGFSTGRTPLFEVTSPGVVQEALDRRYSPEKAIETLLGGLADDVSVDAVKLVEEMTEPESVSESDVAATPVVKLTNQIIRDGINAGASDIHIEPGRKLGAVRYRVDGVLRKHMDLPMAALNRIISRIKVLSRLDIADRLRPQDGKARVQVKNRGYDLRVSTIPAGGAEKCVIRILDSSASLSLDDLELPQLERDGYVVSEEVDGHKAIDLLKEDQEFNLVILDLAMPGLDGRAVLHQVRGSVETAALPVLIQTGTGSDEIEAELLEAGADDYVEKSVDADRFMARVHAVLRRAM